MDDQYTKGCHYPGQCLMPGPHLMIECHTAEMVEAFAAEMAGAVVTENSAVESRAIETPDLDGLFDEPHEGDAK